MKNIYKIVKLSKPQHSWIIFVSLIITVQAILQQATPVTLRFVVDELSNQINDTSGDYQKLVSLFLLILVINITGVILSTLNQRIGDHISSRLGKYLTEVYYRKVFTLPQKYFDSEISGQMVNQLNRGINSIREFVGAATNFIMPSLLQAIFGIGILLYYDKTIGLLALSVFPVYIAISSYSTTRWGKLQEEKNVHEDQTRGRIQEVISNIKLVKTYNTQMSEWKYVSDKYKTINKIYDKQSTQYHILNFIREFGLEISFVAILFLVFRKTFYGELSLGEMVLIIQLMGQLRWPLYGMSYILERIQRAEADSKAFFEVLALQGSEKFIVGNIQRVLRDPEIEFTNVSFSYDEQGKDVLHDLNLKLEKRQKVALVGHSGSGKTTLINLILKLYDPTQGSIKMSRKDYRKINHTVIRNNIALVFQENELFSSTIRENVAYGIKNATDKQVIKALIQANAYSFVKKYKEGLDAKIGERGVKLSGGQKQRIQIARAILHDKPILILDEATSSLDSKSEKYVQDALEKLMKNRLVIIIAHRFSTIQNVDRVVVLNKGRIVDSGKPKELAGRKGIYSELLRYQMEGNKKLLSEYELT
ncbi:ABC transporter ATP-binding protein [Candidatus Woesebacteria bacterium]|nr:MAG: ABC transporter ATP-binding protein [Candidatus Woesebacteria bacterium]